MKLTKPEVWRLIPGKKSPRWGMTPLDIAKERYDYYWTKAHKDMRAASHVTGVKYWISVSYRVQMYYRRAMRWREVYNWLREIPEDQRKLEIYRNKAA